MRIGLISCVKQKADTSRPARDLYTSPYFRKMQAYVLESCDEYRILSAKHGVLHPNVVVAPYDETLNPSKCELKPEYEARQRAWAEATARSLLGEFTPGDVVFELHAGEAYAKFLVPYLRGMGYDVIIPVPEGLKFGSRLQWYNQQKVSA